MTRRYLTLVGLALGPVLVLGVFFVLPVVGMAGRGFVVDGSLNVGGVAEVLARPRTHRVLWFTVWSAGLATLVSVLLGLPAAYVLHRLSFPGRRMIRALLLVPFVLPTVVVGVAFRLLVRDTPLDGSAATIIAGLVFFNVAVVIRAVGATWESLDPRPAEAAAALGASPAQVFRTVTLPALRPAIVSAGSVVFLFCATSYGVVLTLGGLRYSSVETEIYLLTTQLLDLRAAAALSVLQLLAVTALLVLAGRLRAVPDPTVERRTARPRRPRVGDGPQLALTLLMDQWALFEVSLREESGPPAAYDPTRFGESNIYFGPALMWHELRRMIGDEKFWQVTRDWPALDPERSANRDEYLPWLVEQTGVPRAFFDDWLLSPTTPERTSSALG